MKQTEEIPILIALLAFDQTNFGFASQNKINSRIALVPFSKRTSETIRKGAPTATMLIGKLPTVLIASLAFHRVRLFLNIELWRI